MWVLFFKVWKVWWMMVSWLWLVGVLCSVLRVVWVLLMILLVFFRKILCIFGLLVMLGLGVVIGVGVDIGVGVGVVVGVRVGCDRLRLGRLRLGRLSELRLMCSGWVCLWVGVVVVGVLGLRLIWKLLVLKLGSLIVFLWWFMMGFRWLVVLLNWNMCLVRVGCMFSMLMRKFSVFRLLVRCLKMLCVLGCLKLILVLVRLLILLCMCMVVWVV